MFSKLRKPNRGDRVLVLTHTDLDGAGAAIITRLIFPNTTVRHCTNRQMSYEIKNAIMNEELNDQYDTIIACDISCNEHDAEIINDAPIKQRKKLILIDHHDTAMFLNQYDWAVVSNNIPKNSIRRTLNGFNIDDSYLSSGTSLLFDFYHEHGYTFCLQNQIETAEFANLVALYDTWDWNNKLQKNNMMPYEFNVLCDIYGIDEFEDNMVSKLRYDYSDDSMPCLLIDPDDCEVLRLEEKRITRHLEKVSKMFLTGNIQTENGDYYSAVICFTGEYLNNTFDKMKEVHPDYDLYIINYGTGISLRTEKENIHIGYMAKALGGGGHASAGGVKASFDMQTDYIGTIMHANVYLDEKDSE